MSFTWSSIMRFRVSRGSEDLSNRIIKGLSINITFTFPLDSLTPSIYAVRANDEVVKMKPSSARSFVRQPEYYGNHITDSNRLAVTESGKPVWHGLHKPDSFLVKSRVLAMNDLNILERSITVD